MSLPGPAVTAPVPAPSEANLPIKQTLISESLPASSPRMPQLDLVAAEASASSPSNGMSPVHQPTESSRHSTPATSAADSDHAHNTSQSEAASAKPVEQRKPSEPATVEQALPTEEASPAAVESAPVGEPTQPTVAPQIEEHPMASIRPSYFYPIDGSASSSHEGIPVFEPTMQQFQDFYAFCEAIDTWGMQSGIVKVIPPKEWRDSLPDLRPGMSSSNAAGPSSASASGSLHQQFEEDEQADISKVRIRNAIVQHFTPAGSGVWRQTNITRTAKIWNAKQWADTCVSDGQKGPEMDRMKWKVEVEGVSNGGWGPKNIGNKDSAASAILEEDGVRTRSGKARPAAAVAEPKSHGKRKRADGEYESSQKVESAQLAEEAPAPTPPSPSSPERRSQRIVHNTVKTPSVSRDASPVKKKNWEAEAITEDEWRAFDYKDCWRKEALSAEQLKRLDAGNGSSAAPGQSEAKVGDSSEASVDAKESADAPPSLPSPSDWTPEVCREIESEYWRSLNFGKPPMYGADLKGTLFDERTKHWNVGHLDNVLTRLRLKRKLPGVNTPYLYWGMWRATFAWHVEDMDLYSINYIHFGAPKQWYAIRQSDRQRFESAMAGAFPSDSRRCPHFMRHKSYLASPSFLASHGIRPLKLVHHAGEFVITYPYGYHSGFNLGYNCAESVNFALESWLDIGRKANYCHCDQSQNSVRIDVDAMLEESKEMEELERKREIRRAKEESVRAVEEEEMERRRIKNEKAKERRKQKKEAEEAAAAAGPAVPLPFQGGAGFYIDPKAAASSPCVFCPANVDVDMVATPAEIDTNNTKLKAMAGRHAHRLCASFVPETWVGKQGKSEVVCGIEGIVNARFSLKCQICPNANLQKLYPKIQCTRGKCPRSAHVSCALVEDNGWFVDVCPQETADRLEGKKVTAGGNTEPTDGELGNGERLVVLCKTHNPLFREAEEARKAEELRERVYALPIPSMVKIKTSGGMFQALMVELNEEDDTVVIEDEGRPSTVKFQQIIFDSASEPEVKEESQALPVVPVEAVDGIADGTEAPPAKRRRKASEKAVAHKKAASEEAIEASIVLAEAAAATASLPRKTRAPRAKKAAGITPAVVVAEEPQPPEPPAPVSVPAKAKKRKAAAAAAGDESKPKRKYVKKTKVIPAEDADIPPASIGASQTSPAEGQWQNLPPQQVAQPLPPGPQQQQQQQAPPPKRGPRATYAAQAPPSQQQQYGAPPSQFPPHPQQPMQQQAYPGHEAGLMHRNISQPPRMDAGQHYGAAHSPGYAAREAVPEADRSRFAHSSVSASPSFQPQHAAYPPHPQQPQHMGYAPYPYGGPQQGERGHSGSQYGHFSGPPAEYQNVSPPLPTYRKPLAAQPQHLPPPNGGCPNYRGPHNHPAPVPHPGYQQQGGAYGGHPDPRYYQGQPQQQGGGAYNGYHPGQDRRVQGYPEEHISPPQHQGEWQQQQQQRQQMGYPSHAGQHQQHYQMPPHHYQHQQQCQSQYPAGH